MVYTYILKDEDRDIFKIGTTTDPVGRFKEVCSRRKIIPYMLLEEDREKEFHNKYKDMRITHPEQVSGRTEYFKRGGSFIKMAEWIDGQKPIPYISPTEMVSELERSGVLRYDSITVSFEIASSKYGFYILGRTILKLLGVNSNKEYVLSANKKIAVSDSLIDNIIDNFSIRISFSNDSNLYIKDVEGLRLTIMKNK